MNRLLKAETYFKKHNPQSVELENVVSKNNINKKTRFQCCITKNEISERIYRIIKILSCVLERD